VRPPDPAPRLTDLLRRRTHAPSRRLTCSGAFAPNGAASEAPAESFRCGFARRIGETVSRLPREETPVSKASFTARQKFGPPVANGQQGAGARRREGPCARVSVASGCRSDRVPASPSNSQTASVPHGAKSLSASPPQRVCCRETYAYRRAPRASCSILTRSSKNVPIKPPTITHPWHMSVNSTSPGDRFSRSWSGPPRRSHHDVPIFRPRTYPTSRFLLT
jgi:hypothetical protein